MPATHVPASIGPQAPLTMRRTFAAATLFASLALHALLLGSLGAPVERHAPREAEPAQTVAATLIAPTIPAPLAQRSSAPGARGASPRPSTAAARRPLPRPAAITPPASAAASAAIASAPIAADAALVDAFDTDALDGDASAAQQAAQLAQREATSASAEHTAAGADVTAAGADVTAADADHTRPGPPAQPSLQPPDPALARPETVAPAGGDTSPVPAPAAEPSAEAAALVAGASPAAGRSRDAPALLYGRALPAPATGRWRFNVYFGHYRGNYQVASLDYTVDHDGRRYRLRTEGRAEGLTALIYSGVLNQSSVGRLSANGLAPERYAEQRGRRPERWVQVDYDARRVVFSGGEAVELVDGAQDRLSVVIQLGLLARAMPERFAAGAVFGLPEITLRGIERVQYASRGEVSLDTAQGPLRALHLERTGPGHETRFEVWLGYDQGLLPVRIRLTDSGGRVLDQMLAR